MPFVLAEETGGILRLENEFWQFSHDRNQGGELTEAVIRNGSGKNLLAGPQSCAIALREGNSFHTYSTGRMPAEEFRADIAGECVKISFTSGLADDQGESLNGASVQHQITYSPHGFGEHKVTLHICKRIENPGQIQIGKLVLKPVFDFCTVREPLSEQCAPETGNYLNRWISIPQEMRRNTLLLSRHLPLSVLLLRRGEEAIEFSLGDDLSQWDLYPGKSQFLAGCNGEKNLVVRYCPLDSLRPSQALEGDYQFTFRLTFPKIRKTIAPLIPLAGNFLRRTGNFCDRWENIHKLPQWREAGGKFLRLHDDGDAFGNGCFWRDGAICPYPLEEEEKMLAFLDAAHRNDFAVAPYFSIKEFHPEVPDFQKNATQWGRRIDEHPEFLLNYSPKAIFGAQMCLKSPWKEFRLNTVQEILKRYGFDGIYCDWCAGSECIAPNHANGRHWDNDALLKLLLEFRASAPFLYLHLTGTPSLAAENLADLILTEEQPYVDGIGANMFTPHGDFVNIAARQVCEMLPENAPDADRRRLAMAALLHHATVSSVHDTYLKFYREFNISQELLSFHRHKAPGTGAVQCGSPHCGASLYSKPGKTLVLFANFSNEPQTTSYWIAPEYAFGTERIEQIQIPPLSYEIRHYENPAS